VVFDATRQSAFFRVPAYLIGTVRIVEAIFSALPPLFFLTLFRVARARWVTKPFHARVVGPIFVRRKRVIREFIPIPFVAESFCDRKVNLSAKSAALVFAH
jgi:hypothetical protein